MTLRRQTMEVSDALDTLSSRPLLASGSYAHTQPCYMLIHCSVLKQRKQVNRSLEYQFNQQHMQMRLQGCNLVNDGSCLCAIAQHATRTYVMDKLQCMLPSVKN